MLKEKKLLNDYVLDLLESIEQNISAFSKGNKPEFLHRLRVGLKKIKAIFSFTENISKEKIDTTKLKKIFFEAGKIRELGINSNLLKGVPHPPERLITRLKMKENLLIQQFIKKSSKYIILIKNFRKKICLPKKVDDKKTIIEFFKKEKRKANKILKHIEREVMHDYRKKIKRLMYIYDTLPKGMQNKIKLNEVEIDKQQKILGDWHDTYSAINIFSLSSPAKQKSEYILSLKVKEERLFNTFILSVLNKRL